MANVSSGSAALAFAIFVTILHHALLALCLLFLILDHTQHLSSLLLNAAELYAPLFPCVLRQLHFALEICNLLIEPLVRLLGDPFVEAFTIVKQSEYEVFLQVISSWEREHLLLNV